MDAYKFSTGFTQGYLLNVISIEMFSDITPISKAGDVEAHLYEVEGPRTVLLTGQLTGCSFIVRPGEDGFYCTHIKPAGQTGNQLQDQLNGFRMADTIVYGMNDYGNNAVSIIGFHNGLDWSIFAQRRNGRGGPITQVDTIYPGGG